MVDPDMAYKGDVTDVRAIRVLERGTSFNRLWQPFIAVWEDHHLVVTYGRHLRGKVDMGDVLAVVSRDDGRTWSEPALVFDHREPVGRCRYAYANSVLYHPPDQRIIWCYAMRCPHHYRDSEDSELCAAYSVDGGLSWQQIELAVDYHQPLITCAGIYRCEEEGRVRYLLPVHRNTLRHDPGGDQRQLVLESTSLIEWKLAGYVPQPEARGEDSGRIFMHEGNIDHGDRPGELKIVMRTSLYGSRGGALEPPCAYSSTSPDGGRTWAPARQEPFLYNAVSKAYFGCAGEDTHVYVYSTGPAGERKAMAYVVKPPSGEWSEPRPFYDAEVPNSYPTLLEYEPGRFYAVWDSSNEPDVKRTVIRFGRFQLS